MYLQFCAISPKIRARYPIWFQEQKHTIHMEETVTMLPFCRRTIPGMAARMVYTTCLLYTSRCV